MHSSYSQDSHKDRKAKDLTHCIVLTPIDLAVVPSTPEIQQETVAAMQRLRQLATEIDQGLKSGNLDVVIQASSLLSLTLVRCENAFMANTEKVPEEMSRLAAEIQASLDASEQLLRKMMTDTQTEICRVHKGKGMLRRLSDRLRRVIVSRIDSRS